MTNRISELERMTTYFHDAHCRCGGQCFGWENDYLVLEAFLEERYGSASWIVMGMFNG